METDKKCLIIDDDIDLRDGLAELLIDEGYKVDTASDGEHGLSLLTGNTYDLTLLDMKLPKINGMEFLGLMRGNPNAGKIFLISGNPDVEKDIKETGLADTITGVLQKPFSIEEMMELIKVALKK